MVDRQRTVQLGVIGCGRVTAERHLPALHNLADATVVALADIDADRLKQVADRFQVPQRYRDYRAVLAAPGIDAVAVCVPTPLHGEVGFAVLEANKHLFIEKPLALHIAEADRLVARATQSSCKAAVGFNMRCHRLVLQAREIIERGALGTVELLRTAFTAGSRHRDDLPEWRLRHALGGAILLEHAVHHFDLWRFLLQAEVEEVFAKVWAAESPAERATVTAQMTNGVLVASVFSQGVSDSNEFAVYGPSGWLRVSCYRFDGLELGSTSESPDAMRTRLRGMARALKELPQAALRLPSGGDYVESYAAEWRHFLQAIQRDTPVASTLADGWHALRVALAAVESASSGRPVTVARAGAGRDPLAVAATRT